MVDYVFKDDDGLWKGKKSCGGCCIMEEVLTVDLASRYVDDLTHRLDDAKKALDELRVEARVKELRKAREGTSNVVITRTASNEWSS